MNDRLRLGLILMAFLALFAGGVSWWMVKHPEQRATVRGRYVCVEQLDFEGDVTTRLCTLGTPRP